MDLKKITPLLQTSTPIKVFKKVVAFNETAAHHIEKATVRVGLSSGFILEGIPLKMDADKNVVFTSSNGSISYINVQTLAGVELLNPETILEILTDGSYFEVPQNEVPTHLQLKRAFKSEKESIESKFGFRIQSDLLENGLSTEAEKYQFEQFLKMLQETIDDIAKDSLGKEALRELQEMIINAAESTITIKKEHTRLELGINFKNKFSTDFKEQLKVAFESNL